MEQADEASDHAGRPCVDQEPVQTDKAPPAGPLELLVEPHQNLGAEQWGQSHVGAAGCCLLQPQALMPALWTQSEATPVEDPGQGHQGELLQLQAEPSRQNPHQVGSCCRKTCSAHQTAAQLVRHAGPPLPGVHADEPLPAAGWVGVDVS